MPGSLPHRHVGCACGLGLASVGSDVIPFERLLIYSHENYLYLKADCPKSAGIIIFSKPVKYHTSKVDLFYGFHLGKDFNIHMDNLNDTNAIRCGGFRFPPFSVFRVT